MSLADTEDKYQRKSWKDGIRKDLNLLCRSLQICNVIYSSSQGALPFYLSLVSEVTFCVQITFSSKILKWWSITQWPPTKGRFWGKGDRATRNIFFGGYPVLTHPKLKYCDWGQNLKWCTKHTTSSKFSWVGPYHKTLAVCQRCLEL